MKNDISFSHPRWPRSQQATAAALDSVSTGHLALRLFTVSKYQASGTLTYSNGDSVSVAVVSSGLARHTYPLFSQLHVLPGFGSLWHFILSQRSQHQKKRISSVYINISYRKCNALFNFAALPARAWLLAFSDGNGAASSTQETPLFVSKHLWFLITSRGRFGPNYGSTAAGSNPPGFQQTKQMHRRDVL